MRTFSFLCSLWSCNRFSKLALAFIFLFISTARSLPQGAPTKVCHSMLPFHGGGISRQFTASPFGIIALGSDGAVIVTVGSPTELPFQGYMLQARTPRGELLGLFEPLNSESHTIDCDRHGDSVTHSSTSRKPAVEVRWRPPPGYEGSIIFNATVAQDYTTFWVGLESDEILIRRDPQPDFDLPQRQPKVPSTTPPYYTPENAPSAAVRSDPFYNGCSESKLCFGTPDGCVSTNNCEAVAAVTVIGDKYEFELKATSPDVAWVAAGLSSDAKMGDDSVIECVKQGISVRAFSSRTTARPYSAVRLPNPQQGVQLLNASAVDGTLYCKVLRDPKMNVNGELYDLVNNKYNLLVAAGTSVTATSVEFHDKAYLASADKRFLSDVSAVAGASKLLLRLHGAFMITAWICTASIGTLLARYYRKTWVGKTICGKDLWFAWHRFFMVVTWALTTVAFVLIFVELRAWSSENNPHAILGVVVTVLCFLQPIGAFFRPHPGTPKRPIFNWLHWFGGNAAHIIAIITIFFAVKLNKAELPDWFDLILAGFVAFHVFMHLVLSILGCISENSASQRVTAFPMKDLSTNGNVAAHMMNVDAPLAKPRKMLLGLYVLVVILLSAALIAVAVLAPIKT